MIPVFWVLKMLPKSPPSGSIKVVLYINVGVEQLLSVRGQVHLVEDQVLKGLLKVRFPDQHRSHHPTSTENHLEQEYRANVCEKSARCDGFSRQWLKLLWWHAFLSISTVLTNSQLFLFCLWFIGSNSGSLHRATESQTASRLLAPHKVSNRKQTTRDFNTAYIKTLCV